ncbi:hypothetical protein TNCV_4621421 [Trichonephila clavipes]|nr:hypothetical protein TNCV_4621421 [Trichonephila clavipes]
MILLMLSRERDEAPIVTEALGPGPVGPCLQTSLWTRSQQASALGIGVCGSAVTSASIYYYKRIMSTNYIVI